MDLASIRRLLTASRSALRGIRSTPMVFAVSVATMAAGLFLLGTYLLVVQNMRQVLEQFGHGLKLVAFLEPGAVQKPEAIDALRLKLEKLPAVGSARFVSQTQALELLRADLGREAGILEDLERNPLPPSFELELAAENRSPAALRDLSQAVAGIEGVQEVRYGEDWVEGYARVLRAAEWLGVGLGALLLLVLASITAGTVRLAVQTRSDEIQIQRLVGAGGLFVRLPFCVEGALQGAVAAGAALAVLYGLFQLGLPILGELLHFFLGQTAPAFFGPVQIALLFSLGVGLGAGGATLSLIRLDETA